jgi:predicted transcriptional regulator
MWYTTLSLPPDNEHHVLDSIISGEFQNIATEIPPDTTHEHQTNIPGTSFEFQAGSSSSQSGYITREHMEELFSTYKQQAVSDVSTMVDNFTARMVGESAKHDVRYQTILDNQQQLFQQQQQLQHDYHEQFQSMRSYVDTTADSIKSFIQEQNNNVLDQFSGLKSNMDVIINSLQQDVHIHRSRGHGDQPFHPSSSQQVHQIEQLTTYKESKRKTTESSSSSADPLQYYPMDRYIAITDFIQTHQPE